MPNRVGRTMIENERYKVIDLEVGEGMTLSQTTLRPHTSTRGHSHAGAELYFFTTFTELQIDGERRSFRSGEYLIVRPTQFHRVFNDTDYPIDFYSVFMGSRDMRKANYGDYSAKP